LKSAKRKQLEQQALEAQQVRTPAAEQLLIEELPEHPYSRVLCTTLGRGQFAHQAAEYARDAQIVCHCFDLYDAGQVRQAGLAEGGRVQVDCAADFRDGPFDLAVFPIDPKGETELARDILQAGYQRLAVGGRLLAATSNPEDQWLHGELRKLFDKVTRTPQKKGVVYRGTKTGELKKVKNFECEFAFRDRGRLIRLLSRPGVFSHRSLDLGARALINVMEIAPGAKVLDLGCGSGAVALAAAFRADHVQVVGLDSNPRAVECTARGAALNELTTVQAILNADGEAPQPGSYDLVLGNPPYYSDYQIAEIFLQGAIRALKPGGKVLMVCKAHEWYDERMPQLFADVEVRQEKQYFIASGTLP
jgi:16S rRNA G1207 methylase RsmC